MLRAIAERDLADDGPSGASDAAPDAAGNGASSHGPASDGARDGDDAPSARAHRQTAASERDDAEQLARLLCADVRERGGSAVELVIALKEAWAQIPRTDSAQRRRASERLSRMVTLCIDAYYAGRGGK